MALPEILPPYDIEIIYDDEELAVFIKPGGMLAVPGRGPEKQDCAVNRLRRQFPDIISQPAVHRLDMFTSGLMVFAKTSETHRHLSMQFANRQVTKKYIAVLEKDLSTGHGEINLSFRLDPNNRPLQVYDPVHGKPGITEWRRIGGDGTTCTVEFIPRTGRTHQLRLHAAHSLGLNAPIIGDSLYGSGRDGDRMHLHASELSFFNPAQHTTQTFVSAPHFELHSSHR